MSGATGLAAAKRRRSKNDMNNKPQPNSNINNTVQHQPSPNLSIKESIMYLNNRLVILENKFRQDINNPQDMTNNVILNTKLETIEKNMEQLQQLTLQNNNNNNNDDDVLTIEMFNNVISEVANDMSELNNKLVKLNDYINTVQNMNITTNNVVSKLLLQNNNNDYEQLDEHDSLMDYNNDNSISHFKEIIENNIVNM